MSLYLQIRLGIGEKENKKFEEYQKLKKEIASMWKKRTLWVPVGLLQGVAKN